ncbi:MAG: Lpg1974 family pore-forming outer membrane protein [Parachlamydiales bacterium]
MAFASYAYAEEAKDIKQGHVIDENQMVGAYNTPARVDVKGAFDFEINASFIWWEALEQGMDLGYHSDVHSYRHMIGLKESYHPGFKIGIAYNSGFDDWKFALQYLYFYPEDSSSYHSDDYLATNLWISHDATYDKIHGSRSLHLNHIDLLLSRPFYSGAKLTLEPTVGFKAAIDHQQITVKHYVYSTGALEKAFAKDENWFIGPEIGVNANFLLGCGFKFFGNGMGGLFFQRHKVSYDTVYATASENVYARDNYNFFAPFFGLGGGLGWGSYFSNRSWYFDLTAAYEMEHYFDQNSLRGLQETYRHETDGKKGDLTLHGLTVKMAVVF